MKSKAVVFSKPNKVELKIVNLPLVGDNEMLVKSLYSGVSIGTEKWILTNKIQGLTYPIIPGYQNVGRVISIGRKVKNFQEGDIVFSFISQVPLGMSKERGWSTACHMNYLIICVNPNIPQWEPIKLNNYVDLKAVAFLTLATVGFNGANWREVIEKDDTVLVIGQGMVGQMAAQNARLKKAKKIIASDYIDIRVKLSAQYSSDIAINPKKTDLDKIIKKESKEGVDVVIESVGISRNINESVRFIKYGGKMVLLGTYHGVSEIELRKFHIKRITIYTPNFFMPQERVQTLKLITEKRLNIASLITHQIKPEEAPQIYDSILKDPSDMLGVVIDWTEE